jgi:hypothetical protein
VLPWETRRQRRNGRAALRRQPGNVGLERLEGRELLAYTPLGYSLPDLTVTGYTSGSAAWGSDLTVTLDVRNIGAETLTAPLSLQPGAVSPADSTPTTVTVFASRTPDATRPRDRVEIGSIPIGVVRQNSLVQTTQALTLPAQPRRFPNFGGHVFISFTINPTRNVIESDYTNNHSVSAVPTLIASPFPELVAIGLEVPPVMQPGDTIAPSIRIANQGPSSTAPQGPFTVQLLASTQPRRNSGSTVIATYTVNALGGVSQVSSGDPARALDNLSPQNNVATINGAPVTLPVSPKRYFIGVVVDPDHKIRQLHDIGQVRNVGNAFTQARRVGPKSSGLPPAGVLYAGGGANNLPFPYPPNVNPSGTSVTRPQTGINVS